MHSRPSTLPLPLLLLSLLVSGCAWHGRHQPDVLAISDEGQAADPGDPGTFLDDSVKFFDAHSGARLARPGVPPDTGLVGPAGVLFPDGPRGSFLVVNQNQFQPTPGEVRHYDPGGQRLPDLIPSSARHAPWAPRGAVMVPNKDGSRTLFLADQGDLLTRGRLLVYTLRDGVVVNHDDPVNLDPHLRNSDGSAQDYHPRALVLGPDGQLYVSHLGEVLGLPAAGCGGSVLRFDPHRLAFVDVVIENPPLCRDNRYDLHRPEGLAFSPAGDLYVTSYRQRSFIPGDSVRRDDNDRLLIIGRDCLHAPPGHGTKACRMPFDRIDLWRADLQQERAYATAMVFGPDRKLYVPISTSGEVRRYDVGSKAYTSFIAAGSPGAPVTPQYLSFGGTDPATLLYAPPGRRKGE